MAYRIGWREMQSLLQAIVQSRAFPFVTAVFETARKAHEHGTTLKEEWEAAGYKEQIGNLDDPNTWNQQ
jgi:hypothetical protein